MQEAMTIKEFMSRDFKQERIDRNIKIMRVVRTAAYTIVFVSAADVAFASDGIDKAARTIYTKLLSIGKWIIIIKGGIDTINLMVQGDMPAAKKNFFGYLLVYLVLNGLPWAMDEVDKVFKEVQ